MIVTMKPAATEANITAATNALRRLGCAVHRAAGTSPTILAAVGRAVDDSALATVTLVEGVDECVRLPSPYTLASRHFRPGGSVVRIGNVEIGGPRMVVMAGPCGVESPEQVERTAAAVRAAGATILRGGAFKPRTSPYSFQGLGEPGLRMLRAAADRHGLAVVTEVMDASQVAVVADHADLLQIGSRNMQNFTLLTAVGRERRPVLLKRGLSATLEELLLSAEYLLSAGCPGVVLCERGIRTFETYTRNTMDISAIPALKALSHLPVIADPSHGTGRRDAVLPMSRAAVAAGADGLIVEVHPNPARAKSDGPQSLHLHEFAALMQQLHVVGNAVRECLALDSQAIPIPA